MESPVVMQFITKFNPTKRAHVMWLVKIQKSLETMDTTKCHLPDLISQNPMKIKFGADNMADWVHVHFALNFKYAKAVLSAEEGVFVPQTADIQQE